MLRPLPFEGKSTAHLVEVCLGKGSSLAKVLLVLASATLWLGCAPHSSLLKGLQHHHVSYTFLQYLFSKDDPCCFCEIKHPASVPALELCFWTEQQIILHILRPPAIHLGQE